MRVAKFFASNNDAEIFHLKEKNDFKNILDRIHDVFLTDLRVDEIHFKNSRCFKIMGGQVNTEEVSNFFSDEQDLYFFIKELSLSSSLRIDFISPAAGGLLEEKSLRWHAVIAPAAINPILIIRRIRFSQVELSSFFNHLKLDTLSKLLSPDCGVLIFGKTGSGKSTFLYNLLKELYSQKNLVCLEKYKELSPFPHNWVRLVESPRLYSGKGGVELPWLLEQALRLSCDVLCVGEILGKEAKTYIDICESGHGPCFSTIHAANPDACIGRLRSLSGYNGELLFPLVLIGIENKKIRSLHLKRPYAEIKNFTHGLFEK